MEAKGMVAQKREEAIQRATTEKDWEAVSKLLDLPLENALRRDRKNKLVSLNSKNNESETELIETLTDNNDSLTILIQNEEKRYLYQALSKLKDIEREILLDRVEFDWSFSKLARMHNISDKTAKKYYENARDMMKKILIDTNIF
ncbi:sigma factor-like helix-turn-helix DNA-binding protein [Streptococcus suis]|uniref:sigma factor-like helix-turn-helix DNA-binding protein n=1 Tax=Streptococcus suis TaxID=1307 RepID=UPI00041D2F3F|nr:sigma factor-like helix-turn-helix DNA-binding protein [Streptococcus suis]HEL9639628.1 sigma-70 family RNA polymerase sigma factor [Streptococcus suis]